MSGRARSWLPSEEALQEVLQEERREARESLVETNIAHPRKSAAVTVDALATT